MSEDIDHSRRRFLGTAAMTMAAAELVRIGAADAQSTEVTQPSSTVLELGVHRIVPCN
jgi:hypothetical protein